MSGARVVWVFTQEQNSSNNLKQLKVFELNINAAVFLVELLQFFLHTFTE